MNGATAPLRAGVLGASVAALAVLALVLAGPGAERAMAGTECKHADSAISEAKAKQLARALRCLINEDRAARDKGRLRANSDLDRAAALHNNAMIREDCWAHKCPGEPGIQKRIRNSGYLDGASSWRFAELFGCDVTPQAMLDTWLGKDGKRKRLRRSYYRDIGVAAKKDQVPESNCEGSNEVTYTLILAKRSPQA